jgi:hypothetical protein
MVLPIVLAIPGILFDPKNIRMNTRINRISEPETSLKNKSIFQL